MNTLRIEHSVLINLPVEEIFAYISNFENLASWSGAVTSTRHISPEDKLVGSTVQCTISILGKCFDTTYEIVECVPSRYFTFKSISSVAPTLVCYQFEPVEGTGTNVIVDETINFTGGLLGIDEQMIARAIRHQVEEDLQTLKDLLEGTASIYSNPQ